MATYDDNQKKEMVRKFDELRQTHSIKDAVKQVGVSRLSLDKWAKEFNVQEPETTSVQSVLLNAEDPVKKSWGLAMVLMGDGDAVKALLPSAYNILKAER